AHVTADPVVHYRASFAEGPVLAGWGVMAALTLLALRRGPAARLRRLGVLFAWLTALPWIVVPLNMPLAEHRLYAPMAGAAVLGVALAPGLARLASRAAAAARPARHVPRALFATALLAGITLSVRQSLLYRDERELWTAVLADNPDSFRAWWG